MQDNKITSTQNRLSILQWLHRFGWLTSRQISELVWTDKKSALAMAQKTIASMLENKLIIKRKLETGSEAILLSSKGASLLNSELNVKAVSGAKLQLGNAVHRCASNWYLIQEIQNGNKNFFTEFEIQSGKVNFKNAYGKVPDGLVITDFGVVWLEVENAWKNISERHKIVQFCSDTLSHNSLMEELWADNFLFRLKVVAITSYSAEAIVRTFAKDFQDGLITETALQSVWLTYAPMSSSLIYPKDEEIKTVDMWYDLVRYCIEGKPVKF